MHWAQECFNVLRQRQPIRQKEDTIEFTANGQVSTAKSLPN